MFAGNTAIVSTVQKQSWSENVASVASDTALQTAGHAGVFVQILLNTLGESLFLIPVSMVFFSPRIDVEVAKGRKALLVSR